MVEGGAIPAVGRAQQRGGKVVPLAEMSNAGGAPSTDLGALFRGVWTNHVEMVSRKATAIRIPQGQRLTRQILPGSYRLLKKTFVVSVKIYTSTILFLL